MMEKQEILRTENLKKYFRVKGGHTLKAVDGISLTLSKGRISGTGRRIRMRKEYTGKNNYPYL